MGLLEVTVYLQFRIFYEYADNNNNYFTLL